MSYTTTDFEYTEIVRKKRCNTKTFKYINCTETACTILFDNNESLVCTASYGAKLTYTYYTMLPYKEIEVDDLSKELEKFRDCNCTIACARSVGITFEYDPKHSLQIEAVTDLTFKYGQFVYAKQDIDEFLDGNHLVELYDDPNDHRFTFINHKKRGMNYVHKPILYNTLMSNIGRITVQLMFSKSFTPFDDKDENKTITKCKVEGNNIYFYHKKICIKMYECSINCTPRLLYVLRGKFDLTNSTVNNLL